MIIVFLISYSCIWIKIQNSIWKLLMWYVGGPLWRHSIRSKMTIIALWSARFFKFVYFMRHSHVTGPENQWNCIISGMSGPPGFHFLFIFPQMGPKSVVCPVLMSHKQTWKTGWTTRNFMPYLADLLPFMFIFKRMLWRQSCPPIPSSSSLHSWYNN